MLLLPAPPEKMLSASSKPIVFDPYARRRARVRVPRWLLLLLLGVAAGVGGVLFVQQRYLPPRLSAPESSQLRADFASADAERTRLRGVLAETEHSLKTALDDRKHGIEELAASQDAIQRLRGEVDSLVAFLPSGPRGGAVQVRAARFTVEGGNLVYDVVLSRDRAGGKALAGVLQLVVAGAAGRGTQTTVPLRPVAISVGSHESLHGGLPLPDGFSPRQVTIKVLDRPDGKLLGMRVMHVS